MLIWRVFWNFTPCSLEEGTCCFHLVLLRWRLHISSETLLPVYQIARLSSLSMETVRSSKTLVTTCQSTRRYLPEDSNLLRWNFASWLKHFLTDTCYHRGISLCDNKIQVDALCFHYDALQELQMVFSQSPPHSCLWCTFWLRKEIVTDCKELFAKPSSCADSVKNATNTRKWVILPTNWLYCLRMLSLFPMHFTSNFFHRLSYNRTRLSQSETPFSKLDSVSATDGRTLQPPLHNSDILSFAFHIAHMVSS
jgi:hypothetical protein